MQEPEKEERSTVVFKGGRTTGYSHFPRETFTLQDGDKVGDVLFEAGEYTLEQIVERCNRDSRKFFARLEDESVKLRPKMAPVGAEAVTIGRQQPQPTPEFTLNRNRHERRKARALARRARG